MRGWSPILLLAAAHGQTTTGVIHGVVADAAGRAVAGAEVRASNTERRVTRSTTTGFAGAYRIDGLPPGAYDVTAAAPKLQAVTATGVMVRVDSRTAQDLVLEVAPMRQSIEVAAPPRALESESPAAGLTLDRASLEQLPLNRRDFLQLSFLAPGVLPPVQDSELSSRGSFAMHASGGREEFNNFTIDGADNNDQYTNRYVLQPSLESIREFKVLAASYGAEYGRGAGGQINVVTRSGGASWHGAVYDYFRNGALDARNFFDSTGKPGYRRNQFGGAAGGPLVRDRAFVFATYEGLRERRGLTRLATVPTLDDRDGVIPAGRIVVDPFTQRPFTGDRLPAARISPVARRVLDLYPLPNRPGAAGNSLSQPVLRDRLDHAFARVDLPFSNRSRLAARFGLGDDDLLEPFAEESTDVPGFGNFVRNTGHSIAAEHQYVLGPRSVNTARINFGRSFRHARQQNHAVDAGALWGVDWLRVRPRDFGFPSIKTAGYSVAGDVDQLPLERTTHTWQFAEAISISRGAHALKFGGEVRRFSVDGFLDYFARGSLTFSGVVSGSGISDLLLGFPSFGIQSTFDNRQKLRTTSHSVYFQDDWRPRRDLSLSLGVRYEYHAPPVDPDDRMYILDAGAARLVRVGENGVPRAGYRGDRNNAAPRIGVAWTPGGDWAVRAGYGVYHDAGMTVVNSSLYFNPPLFNVRIFFPTQTSLLTLNNPFPTGGGITPPPSPSTLAMDITTGYLQHWSLTVERRLAPSATASVAYVASKGTHLIRSRDINQPPPGPGAVAARRPNPAFGGVFFTETSGHSVFHSLQALVDRRLSRGLGLVAAYTWSKSIDDTSAFLATKPDKNFPQDSRNYRAERGLSSFDMPHRFSLAAVARSPWRHWASRATDLRLIAVAQAGQPFTPVLRFDNSNTGNTGGIFGSDRPDVLRDPRLADRTPERWFDTSAFRLAPQYRFGSAGRNIVRGPGIVQLDAGISRRFRVAEAWRLVADAQAFNLANRAQFDLPERFADEPAPFGRIFSAKAPRQLQLALRLEF